MSLPDTKEVKCAKCRKIIFPWTKEQQDDIVIIALLKRNFLCIKDTYLCHSCFKKFCKR